MVEFPLKEDSPLYNICSHIKILACADISCYNRSEMLSDQEVMLASVLILYLLIGVMSVAVESVASITFLFLYSRKS